MKPGGPPINDGWHAQTYDFGSDQSRNLRLSALLNECCHVFRLHADGHWASAYKPRFVASLAAEIQVKPSLIRKLLALRDPVIRNVTHAAIEWNKQRAQRDAVPGDRDSDVPRRMMALAR